jgi:NHLM bacteriocin system ABC transporter peptidase/ATP-binding protein
MTDTPPPNIPRWKKGRVRTPTLIQMEAVECGATALGIVLGYFGRFEPLEVLREACGVSRDGSKASNVLKAARRFGLETKGYRMEINDLTDLSLPIIVFWNFNHFLVLEGTRGNKVYLNDPAKGPRVVSFEEFDDSFTGIALEFKKGPDFRPGGHKASIWPLIRRRLDGCRTALAFTMLCALFMVIPGLVIPFFSQIFIDHVLTNGLDSWFKPLLLAMVVAATLQAALVFIQKIYLLRMETKLALKGTTEFVQRIFSLPVSFFFQRMAGDLTSRVGLNDKVAQVLAQQVAPNIMNLFMLLFYLIVMFQYDRILSLVAMTMAGLNFVALSVVSSRKKNLSQKMLHEHNKLMGQSMTGLQLIETLKASGSESDFFSRWAGYQAKSLNARQEFSRTNQYLAAVPPLLTAINNACILGIGGFRIVAGDLTIGQLVAFQFLVGVFIRPVIQLVNTGSTLQNTVADMNQLDDVLRCETDPMVTGPAGEQDETPAFVPEGLDLKLPGALALKNVSFGYSKLEKSLITGFNLKLSPGSRVALVGASGSGKSTIAKVIIGLYPAWEGEILFDKIPIMDLHRHIFVRSVASVDQDIFLFDGTIRENLTMWDENVPEKALVQAARDAQIYEVIMGRPGGFDSKVEEGGRNFSGGQGQRLEIARALVGNPSILILDEATSALDPQTEKLVDEAIRRRGCTCLIIAHRLSTIRDADEIIVLKKGEVVQRGSHEELKDMEGLYADLIAAQ